MFHWIHRGFWTIADQAFFAGTNFALNLLLARWLSPADYGVFAVAFTVFLLASMFHTGLLSEPMLVFGAGKVDRRLPAYFKFLLQGHVALTVAIALLLLLVAAVLDRFTQSTLPSVLAVLALCQPFILFSWLARRACYIRLRPRIAALAGVAYLALTLAGLFLLVDFELLSVSTALALMAVSSVAAGLLIVPGLEVDPKAQPGRNEIRTTVRRHWRYGRWATMLGLVNWVPGQVAFLLLPLWAGLAGSASLKALMNLALPVTHVYAALTVLMLPAFVRARAQRRFMPAVRVALGVVGLGTAVYGLAIFLWGEALLHWLYNGTYDAYGGLLAPVAMIPVLGGLVAVAATALKALERPRAAFWGYAAASASSLSVGLYLMWRWGVAGALWANFLALVIALAVLSVFLLRLRTRMPAGPLRPALAPVSERLRPRVPELNR